MIPRINDFIEMARLLGEGYPDTDLSNVVVEFSVSKGILQKINEELYFRNNGDNLVFGTPPPSDEVDININNIRFRCVEAKNGTPE